jgi:hypothetical protein
MQGFHPFSCYAMVASASVQVSKRSENPRNAGGGNIWRKTKLAQNAVHPMDKTGCTFMFAVAQTDPNHERLAELLEVRHQCFGDYPRAARDAVKQAETHSPLKAILVEIAGKGGVIDTTRLGYWLKRHEGKVIAGRRFERDQAKTAYAKYAVRTLTHSQAAPESPTTPATPTAEEDAPNRTYRAGRASTAESETVSAAPEDEMRW